MSMTMMRVKTKIRCACTSPTSSSSVSRWPRMPPSSSRSAQQWRRRNPKESPSLSATSSSSSEVNARSAAEREVPSQEKVENTSLPANYLPLLSIREVPRGERKVVPLPDGSGQDVLVLWYRGVLRCIENRSPAEGAYSEGLAKARFTQNTGIVCPTTASVFSLETGEVMEWFPDNPVLAQLTPKSTARPLEVFPVMLKGDEQNGVVYVDPGAGSIRKMSGGKRSYTVRRMSGGFGTSLEDNNVFGVEPQMYLEGTEPGTPVEDEEAGSDEKKISPAVVISATLAVAIVAVAGTATALYYESLPALAALWLTLFGGAAYATYSYLKQEGDI